MSKEKDRNESTTVILREFNCELIDKLKKFTGERTNTKAIELVCARYLALESLADSHRNVINDLENRLERTVRVLKVRRDFEKETESILKYEKEGA